MKTSLLVVLAVATVIPCRAHAQQQWPRKGDKVFIAASFEGMFKMRVGSQKVDLPLDSCTELLMKDAKPDKARWTVVIPLLENRIWLEGPWHSRIHRTQAECRSQMSTDGDPRLVRSGDRFTIIPPPPG